MQKLGRSLHFIVRHPEYEHTLGYGHFLNYVLSKLNEEKPKTARELLEHTALLMRNETKESSNNFVRCLPPSLRHLGVSEKVFGPAVDWAFGVLSPDQICEENTKGHRIGPDAVEIYGYALTTDILYPSGNTYRGYFDILAANHGLQRDNIPQDFSLQFTYPIPNSAEKLSLMKVGSPANLGKDIVVRYLGDPDTIRDYVIAPFVGSYAMNGEGKPSEMPELYRKKLIFLHPHCDKAYFDKLLQCIEPLIKTIDAPAGKVETGASPPEDKLDAMITVHWLLAQTTPVVRGGSAMANVVLEHLAQRLRDQGYAYDIPYTRQGVDLWAEAATLPLEDQQGLKGFKTRFKEGLFFDKSVTDEQVQDYLYSHLASADHRAQYSPASQHQHLDGQGAASR